MTYPAILLVVAVAAISIMLLFVIPTFSAFSRISAPSFPPSPSSSWTCPDMLRNKSPSCWNYYSTVAFLVWYLRTPRESATSTPS